MIKKRINKKLVKTKSYNFKIPESFSGLNFNQKIISIILITLVIGVVASLFSNNITGMAAFGQSFESIKGTLSSVNNLITTIFSVFFPGEKDPLMIYARFVLFALVIGITYFLMRVAGSENPFINFLAGIAIAYLSTFFIPMDALLGTGILYSSTFISLMLLIPFILLWFIYFVLPLTKGGYVIRTILCLIMLNLFQQDVFSSTSNLINNLLFIGRVVAFGAGIYSFIRIFTIKAGEGAEVAATKRVTTALKTRIDQLLAKKSKNL